MEPAKHPAHGGSTSSQAAYAGSSATEGEEQVIRINPRGILENAMEALGAEAPVFSVVECGDSTVKVSIRLVLSNVISSSGDLINYSVILGEASSNPGLAQRSACVKAISFLENNYLIKIFDFSSRATAPLDSTSIHDIVCEGIGSLENVIVQWEMAFVKFTEFLKDIENNEFSGHFGGPLTPCGKVYGVIIDQLYSTRCELDDKQHELRPNLDDIKSDWSHYDQRRQEKAQIPQREGPFCEVILSTKALFDRVLSHYALQLPQYTNSPDPFGQVISTTSFEFPPFLKDFKFGGKLAISGKADSSIEAEEEAAYQSLLFIEEHYRTSVLDHNYT